jgi:predicted lipoprotein with Yx(FWY)xxD motif
MKIFLDRALAAVMLGTCACALSACGVRDLGTSAPPNAVAEVEPPAAVRPQAARAPERRISPVLKAKAIRKHGTVVVDVAGLTLYRSDKDSARPPRSRCTGSCTLLWKPAVATDADLPVTGIDSTLVGTITRADGTHQLTLAGWPVYRFAKDRRPGDVKGQCKGKFFAITPDGGRSM